MAAVKLSWPGALASRGAGAKASAEAAARPLKMQNQGQKVATTKEKKQF